MDLLPGLSTRQATHPSQFAEVFSQSVAEQDALYEAAKNNDWQGVQALIRKVSERAEAPVAEQIRQEVTRDSANAAMAPKDLKNKIAKKIRAVGDKAATKFLNTPNAEGKTALYISLENRAVMTAYVLMANFACDTASKDFAETSPLREIKNMADAINNLLQAARVTAERKIITQANGIVRAAQRQASR